MRRLAAALALAALAACGKSPCQELGERICGCQPGLGSAQCTSEIEQQLRSSNPGESYCRAKLDSCSAPEGLKLCEWMLTPDGKVACGLSPAPAP
jgi:hypothetical protein